MRTRSLCLFIVATAMGLAMNVVQAADGAELYSNNCMMCHQTGGTGLAGTFPRLAGRVSTAASAAKGREYLIDVVTFGLSTSITVDGRTFFGMMPSFKTMSDDDVAAVLSYVASLGNTPSPAPRPFSVEEITKQRQTRGDQPPDVAAERSQLQGKIVPP